MEQNLFAEGMMQGPEGALLRFFYDSEKNEFASQSAGRAIFDTVLFVDVITPGQKSSTPRFEVERTFSEQAREVTGNPALMKRSYKYNEYKEWVERYKRDEAAQDLGGTPLKDWPRIDRGLQATLYAANVFTVEALADLSDANLGYLGMGARDLREQAKAWLAAASGGADTSKLVAENVALREENARIQADMQKLNTMMTELQAKMDGKMAGGLPELI